MELSDLIRIETDELEGWFAYRDPFEIKLRFLPRPRLEEITRRCTRTIWRKHQAEQELDSKRLALELASYIVDWRGVTKNGEPWPCTQENKTKLLLEAYDFDRWLTETITDIEAMQQARRDAELKNSGTLSRPD